MDIEKLKEKILKRKVREEAVKIVIACETRAYYTGISSIDIMREYIKETRRRSKKPNEYIEYVIRNAETKRKLDLYRRFMPEEIVDLMSLGETLGKTAEIVISYTDAMEVVKKGQNKIKGVIIEPLASYILISIMGFFILKTLVGKLKEASMPGLNLGFIHTEYNLYWFVIIGILLAVIIPFWKYPYKVPILKDAYINISAFKYLAIMKTFFSLGLSSQEVDEKFRKSVKEYKPKKKGFDGILEFLEYYLDDVDIAVVTMSIKNKQQEQFIKTINSILEAKKSEFNKTIDQTAGVLSKALIVLSAIPIAFIMIAIAAVVMGAFSMMNHAGAM
ncbi:MAG TPA: hypothetical protein ENO30_05020 [Thermodesulfobium narugense]|nr:hypothetical protein [Thermodesulfobium narugense]